MTVVANLFVSHNWIWPPASRLREVRSAMRLVFFHSRLSSSTASCGILLPNRHHLISKVSIKGSVLYPTRSQSTNTSMSEHKTASGDSTRRPEPAKPRLSASILLLNAKNEILMIQRTKESRTFSGMHVSFILLRVPWSSQTSFPFSSSFHFHYWFYYLFISWID